jgi:hypothetical protein
MQPSNITEIGYKALEYSSTVNTLFSYKVPYELNEAKRYPDASIAIYDVNSLMTDIYNQPQLYLNGSSPLNVTGYYSHCAINGPCSLDSFLWHVTPHPLPHSLTRSCMHECMQC